MGQTELSAKLLNVLEWAFPESSAVEMYETVSDGHRAVPCAGVDLDQRWYAPMRHGATTTHILPVTEGAFSNDKDRHPYRILRLGSGTSDNRLRETCAHKSACEPRCSRRRTLGP